MIQERTETEVQAALQALIDRKLAIADQIKQLQDEDSEVSGEIVTILLSTGQKQAYGTDGRGFSVQSGSTRYEFGKMAYRYLEDKGLIHHFVGDPKITKGKLDTLLKDGTITYADMAEIDKFMTTDQSPYTLRKVVDKEAVIR